MTKDEFKAAMDALVKQMNVAKEDLQAVQALGKDYIKQAEKHALWKHWLNMATDRAARLAKEIREFEKVWIAIKKSEKE